MLAFEFNFVLFSTYAKSVSAAMNNRIYSCSRGMIIDQRL